MKFEVERFERVTASSGALLLRVAGRWRSATERNLGMAALLVDDGRGTHRLDPLPGPDATTVVADQTDRPWRAAFAAPARLLDAGPRAFFLQVGELVVSLPAPVPAEVARRQTALERELAATRVEADGLHAEVAELNARLEAMELTALDAHASAGDGLEALQAAASVERERADRLEEELERTRAELAALRMRARRGVPPTTVPVQRPTGRRPHRGRRRSAPGGLPAEWLVALVLLAVGVVVVLLILSGGALL